MSAIVQAKHAFEVQTGIHTADPATWWTTSSRSRAAEPTCRPTCNGKPSNKRRRRIGSRDKATADPIDHHVTQTVRHTRYGRLKIGMSAPFPHAKP